jgi:hypothetical protein
MAVSRVKATLAKKEARKTIDHFAPTSGESGGGGFVRVHRLPPFVVIGFIFRFRKGAFYVGALVKILRVARAVKAVTHYRPAGNITLAVIPTITQPRAVDTIDIVRLVRACPFLFQFRFHCFPFNLGLQDT